MTAKNRSDLKALFETGDTLLQTSFEDLIDSFLSLTDTAAQTVSSDVVFAGKVDVSALDLQVVSAQTVGANSVSAQQMVAVSSFFSQGSTVLQGAITESDFVTSVAARGTTQASAAEVSAVVTRIGNTSAAANAVVLKTAVLGGKQQIRNAGAVTAQVFPAGANTLINELATGAAFELAPNTGITVYGVGGTPFLGYITI